MHFYALLFIYYIICLLYYSLHISLFVFITFCPTLKVFQEHPLCWNYEDCLEKTGRSFSYLPHIGPTEDSQFGNLAASINGSTNASGLDAARPTTVPVEFLVQPNTALLSMTLTLFTFALAYYFKGLRNAQILGRTVSEKRHLFPL